MNTMSAGDPYRPWPNPLVGGMVNPYYGPGINDSVNYINGNTILSTRIAALETKMATIMGMVEKMASDLEEYANRIDMIMELLLDESMEIDMEEDEYGG